VVGRDIFVVAGGPKPGGSFSNVNEVFQPPAREQAGDRQTILLRPVVDNSFADGKKRASSQHVGSVMAMLATFEEAQVLPPETSAQANRIIKVLIQFQSAFLKSRQPAVRNFFAAAQRAKFGPGAEEILNTFQQNGWTSEVLEALSDYGTQDRVWENGDLAEGLREYNVTRQDFDLLIDLFQRAKTQFHARGTDVHQVYAARRRDMPGAAF
jgi:hypothetical protein